MAHISHSQFTTYNDCNLKWKLRYVDKLGTFVGNIHTLFWNSNAHRDTRISIGNVQQVYRCC